MTHEPGRIIGTTTVSDAIAELCVAEYMATKSSKMTTNGYIAGFDSGAAYGMKHILIILGLVEDEDD